MKPWQEWRGPGWWQVSEEEWAWRRSGEWGVENFLRWLSLGLSNAPPSKPKNDASRQGCVGLSGARGLTLKEGHPLSEVA